MKFFDELTKKTIRDEVNRILGTTDAVFSLQNKVAGLDHALDEYWFLAAESAPQGLFDDTTNTSIPLETQTLTSGTNAYKMTAFDSTNNVLQILRVAILDSNGKEHDLIYEDFDDIPDFIETYDTAVTGVPYKWTKVGDYIYLRNTPDYTSASALKVYVNRELSKFTNVVFTTTNASNQIDATAHGLDDGDVVLLTTNNTLPSGYSANTVYYVITSATNSFQVATAGGGSAVALADDGTGTHNFVQINKAPGIPVIHHKFLSRYIANEFMNAKHPKFGKVREQLAIDKRDIQAYWQSTVRPGKTVIETTKRLFK